MIYRDCSLLEKITIICQHKNKGKKVRARLRSKHSSFLTGKHPVRVSALQQDNTRCGRNNGVETRDAVDTVKTMQLKHMMQLKTVYSDLTGRCSLATKIENISGGQAGQPAVHRALPAVLRELRE